MTARLAFVAPPVIKPCEPGISSAAASSFMQSMGVDAFPVDGSIGWYRHTLAPERLAAALEHAERSGSDPGRVAAYRTGVKAVTAGPNPLQQWRTYRRRHVYSSEINNIDNTLRLASLEHKDVTLRIADMEWRQGRPQSSAALAWFARQPGPFDAYFTQELLPLLAARQVTHLAISLSFLNQAFAAFRLAHLAREHLPGVVRWLGGPLPACWNAIGAPMSGDPFTLFHRVVPGSHEEMEAWARELGGQGPPRDQPLSVDLDHVVHGHYLAPMPVIPVALGRGCYWRRCAFCPDHLHPGYQPCATGSLSSWLRRVAGAFPHGAMVHLTDSAVAPALLHRLSTVIHQERLPLFWHGFVRMERCFTDPDFVRTLALGGCAMLQFGMETASPRLLERMDKGCTPEQASAVLRTTAEAGIGNLVYLLFGLPTETEADREETLTFLESHAPWIQDINPALLNLPRGSPLHAEPSRYGITEIIPFGGDTDLSLYDDFRCHGQHPRLDARRWLGGRLLKSVAVRRMCGDLKDPFKANHACFFSPALSTHRGQV